MYYRIDSKFDFFCEQSNTTLHTHTRADAKTRTGEEVRNVAELRGRDHERRRRRRLHLIIFIFARLESSVAERRSSITSLLLL